MAKYTIGIYEWSPGLWDIEVQWKGFWGCSTDSWKTKKGAMRAAKRLQADLKDSVIVDRTKER